MRFTTTTTATTSARSRRSVAPIVTRDLWKAVLPIIFLWIVKSSFALVSSRAPASSSSYSTTTTTTISSSLTVLGRPGNLGSTLFARQERRTATANSCVVALFASSSSSSNDDGNDGAANDNNNNIGKNQSLSYNNNDDDDDTTVTNTIVDPVIQLPLLQAKLAVATTVVEREDLQGKIDNARMAGEFGVRKAQVDFYTAFSTRNLEAMQDVWGGGAGAGSSSSNDCHCRCVHPGMPSIVGRDAILESWASIFQGPGGGFLIEPAETTIDICGATAICKCVERINNGGKSGGALEAINIYKRQDGNWKMTFHMASPFLAANKIE